MSKLNTKRYIISPERFFWIIAACSLFFSLFPILSNNYPAGWDTPGHYFLFEKMLELLKQGKLQGYDTSWFGGYPLFSLYPPFYYLLLSIIYFLTLTLIPKVLFFNISLFLLPFFFLYSLRLALSQWFSKKHLILGLYLGLLYLFTSVDQAHMGIGLGGMFFAGLPPNNFALCLFLLVIAYLKKLKDHPSKKNILICIILNSLILYTHLLTGIFLIFTWAYFLVSHWSLRKQAFIIAIGTSLLISPWLWHFIQHLPYSSGDSIGLRHDVEGFSDPFFNLYPNLTFNYLSSLFNFNSKYVEYTLSSYSHFFFIQIHHFLAHFPFASFIFLFGSISGLYFLIKHKKHFWFYFFILSLLILPRDLLNHLIPLAIHYYRFSQFIVVLNIFISAYGLFEFYRVLKEKGTISYRLLSFLCVACFVFSILHSVFFGLKWNVTHRHGHYTGYNPNFRGTLKKYPTHTHIKETIDYLAKQNVKGRIVIESPVFAMFYYGSPHILSSLLPLEQKYEIFPGLLAESSLSAGFINPTIGENSKHIVWGRNNLSNDPSFGNNDLNSMLRRLNLFNTEYIISFSLDYYNALKNQPKLTLLKQFGEIGIFKFKKFRPKLVSLKNYKPFLFINLGGTNFRHFSEHWYKYPKLLDYPIIFSNKNLSKLPKKEIDRMGGLILSFPGGYKLSKKEFDYWKKQKEKVFFINASPPKKLNSKDKKFFFQNFHLNHKKWKTLFLNTIERDSKQNELMSYKIKKDTFLKKILFHSNENVLINYNFNKCWKSEAKEQNIYWATPSHMFLFGEGLTFLECK